MRSNGDVARDPGVHPCAGAKPVEELRPAVPVLVNAAVAAVRPGDVVRLAHVRAIQRRTSHEWVALPVGMAETRYRFYPTPDGPDGAPTIQQLADAITCP
jgi:hypothetical protein